MTTTKNVSSRPINHRVSLIGCQQGEQAASLGISQAISSRAVVIDRRGTQIGKTVFLEEHEATFRDSETRTSEQIKPA